MPGVSSSEVLGGWDFARLASGEVNEVVIHLSGADLLELLREQERMGYMRAVNERVVRSRGVVSRREAMKILGVTSKTMTVWKKTGRLVPCYEKGNQQFYLVSDVEAQSGGALSVAV